MQFREPRPGEIIGQNYVIENELGRGGFGVVFSARHRDIDRVVALKVLLATYAKKDPTAVERFRREATIAASLNYPNTVRVFDYGETDEGVFYLIMEFIQGRDLTHTIARAGRLGLRRALHIIRQVLHAMMEAHSRGIIHRDIKPDNIMLVPLGYDPDFVKVMDFGIAKMVHGGADLTGAGITLGTPRYMPIEQLKGHDLSPATDLYAVGLVLYEMLVGAPAFDAPSAVDIAVKVMRSPSLRVPASAGLPSAVAALIERACAREPDERFQSAGAFLEALSALDPTLLDAETPSARLDHRLDPPGRAEAIAALGSDEGDHTLVLDVEANGDADDRTLILDTTRADDPPLLSDTAGDQTLVDGRAPFGLSEALARATSKDEPPADPGHRHTTALPIEEARPSTPRPQPPAPQGSSPLVLALHGVTILLLLVLLTLYLT